MLIFWLRIFYQSWFFTNEYLYLSFYRKGFPRWEVSQTVVLLSVSSHWGTVIFFTMRVVDRWLKGVSSMSVSIQFGFQYLQGLKGTLFSHHVSFFRVDNPDLLELLLSLQGIVKRLFLSFVLFIPLLPFFLSISSLSNLFLSPSLRILTFSSPF